MSANIFTKRKMGLGGLFGVVLWIIERYLGDMSLEELWSTYHPHFISAVAIFCMAGISWLITGTIWNVVMWCIQKAKNNVAEKERFAIDLLVKVASFSNSCINGSSFDLREMEYQIFCNNALDELGLAPINKDHTPPSHTSWSIYATRAKIWVECYGIHEARKKTIEYNELSGNIGK